MRGAAAAFHCAAVAAVMAGAAQGEVAGDPARGAALWDQCSACHQIGEGAVNRIGPHLNGVFDRAAAAVPGARYSPAMVQAGAGGMIWSYQTLDAFLKDPAGIVAGTRMSFRGMPDRQERDDILAYLRQFSAVPSDYPDAAPFAQTRGPDLDPAILALSGDPAYGEYLSGECAACHQRDGGATGIPSITNWQRPDFVVAMHAYKTGERDHPVMQMMASRLSNEEIAALAAYFEGVE